MMSPILVEARVVRGGKLSGRCPFCSAEHIWDPEGRKPVGGILYVDSVCDERRAYERDGMRRQLALRVKQT